MSHNNCPECGSPGRLVSRTDSGRAVFTCPRCPKTLVRKGHEVGFTPSGPRWMGPRPEPQPHNAAGINAKVIAGLAILAAMSPSQLNAKAREPFR